jgi:hypothetical protein
MDMGFILKSKVEDGGFFDHRPISLQWKYRTESSPYPLKVSQI